MSEPTKTNTSIAVNQLRSLIFSGHLGAGTFHLESELADNLGMSRTPVREALLRLEGQGLVEVRPRKGVRIVPLSPTDMEEVYDVLTELESLAAYDAAQKVKDESELAALSQSIDAMDDALARNDMEAWALADDKFHNELVLLGKNSRVQAIVSMMSDQVRRARMVTLYMRPKPTKSNADHRGVLEAIRVGDADRARSVHREHRQNAKSVLIELLTKHQLRSL